MPRASTKRVKEPVQTTSSRTGRPRRRPFLLLATGGTAALATLTAANLTEWGRFATAYLFVALNFYIGVVSLVSLSLTVMAGLVSTDRIILKIGHRVLFQGIHRATAILAMVALGIHIAVKVLSARRRARGRGGAVLLQGRSLFIGFGTIAAYLMLLSFWVGIARIRFIGRARPWLWRALHCSAYASWLVALAHGLNAGRPAATWVTVSYLACVIGVSLALLVRLYTRFGRYAPGTRAERAVGVNAQTAVMPRFQDTRVPLAAPRSPVDVRPGSSQPADLSQVGRRQLRIRPGDLARVCPELRPGAVRPGVASLATGSAATAIGSTTCRVRRSPGTATTWTTRHGRTSGPRLSTRSRVTLTRLTRPTRTRILRGGFPARLLGGGRPEPGGASRTLGAAAG